MKRTLSILFFVIAIGVFSQTEPLPLNISNIRNMDGDILYGRLRPTPTDYAIDEQATLIIDLIDTVLLQTCIVKLGMPVSNAYVQETGIPIAYRIEYTKDPICGINDRYVEENQYVSYWTVLISKSTMAGYPEYPMFDLSNPVDTLQVEIRKDNYDDESGLILRYGTIKINSWIISIRSHYHTEQNSEVLDTLKSIEKELIFKPN